MTYGALGSGHTAVNEIGPCPHGGAVLVEESINEEARAWVRHFHAVLRTWTKQTRKPTRDPQ